MKRWQMMGLLCFICGILTTPRGIFATSEGEKKADSVSQPKGNGRVPGGEGKVESASAMLTSIKFWTNPDYTRIIFQLSSEGVGLSASPLEQRDEQGPYLRLNLGPTRLDPVLKQSLKVEAARLSWNAPGGLVRRLSFQDNESYELVLRLDTQPLQNFRVTRMQEPPRLVLDLFGRVELPADDDPLRAVVGTLASGGSLSYDGPPARVVIDAGHGGHERGAVGPTGIQEKDITLAIALKVKERLSGMPNLTVILTRETDVVVPLADRSRIANEQNADLFVSIHCNASPRADRFGLETYYLENATDAAAEKLAARENIGHMEENPIDFIVKDLVIGGNVEYSKRLARAVHERLWLSYQQHYPSPTLKNLGIKTALFYVLYGAQMPSILLELAFISHPLEEQRLKESGFQEQVAVSIQAGVLQYLRETKAQSGSNPRSP